MALAVAVVAVPLELVLLPLVHVSSVAHQASRWWRILHMLGLVANPLKGWQHRRDGQRLMTSCVLNAEEAKSALLLGKTIEN